MNIYVGNGRSGHYYSLCYYNKKLHFFDDSSKDIPSFKISTSNFVFVIYKKYKRDILSKDRKYKRYTV